MNRKKLISFLTLSFGLAIFFQNCSGNFNSLSSTDASGVSSESTGDTVASSQDQLNRKMCSANFNSPTVSAPTVIDWTAYHGQGMGSGDSVASALASIAITANKNTISASVDSTYNCNTITEFEVDCGVMQDSSHPIVINKALDQAGNSLVAANMSDELKRSIANMALSTNMCNNQPLLSGSEKSFKFSINRGNNQVRCVDASFYVSLKVNQTVNYNNMNVTKSSPVQYVKVNLKDGCWNETRIKENGADFPKTSQVGSAVAMTSSWAAIAGSQSPMGSVANVGAVYMYQKDATKGWIYNSTIQPNDGQADDTISSVAIAGDTLVIGSAYRGGQGQVLVYRWGGSSWTKTQTLTSPVSQPGQLFGYSLSFDGSNLAVGAPHHSNSPNDRAGQVYVYNFNGSSFGSPFTISNSGTNSTYNGFGMSVALKGSQLVIGAPMAITKESLGKGFARHYSLSSGSWALVSTMMPTSNFTDKMGLRFGASVAINTSSQIIVSAPNSDSGMNTNAGGACLFNTSKDTSCARFWSGTNADGNFGSSVAFNSSGVLIGCPYCAGRGGRVFFYSNANLGTAAYALFNSNQTNNDGFGWSIASADNFVLAGARIKNDPNQSSGAAFIYQMK